MATPTTLSILSFHHAWQAFMSLTDEYVRLVRCGRTGLVLDAEKFVDELIQNNGIIQLAGALSNLPSGKNRALD